MIDEPRWYAHGLPSQPAEDWHDAEPPDRGFRDPLFDQVGWCSEGQHDRCMGKTFRRLRCLCPHHAKEKAA